MLYQIVPVGNVWQDGMVAVPKKVATDYIKLASEYQLKALLLILSTMHRATANMLQKHLDAPTLTQRIFWSFG